MTTTERYIADTVALGDDADMDETCAALSNPRRRFIVAYLDEHRTPLPMAELAVELASRETDTPRDRLSDEQVRSREIVLHHMHVPKLASLGIVDHDRAGDTVALTDRYDGISAHGAFSLD